MLRFKRIEINIVNNSSVPQEVYSRIWLYSFYKSFKGILNGIPLYFDLWGHYICNFFSNVSLFEIYIECAPFYYHPNNFWMERAIVIKVVSRLGIVSCHALLNEIDYGVIWWKTTELTFLSWKWKEIRKIVIYKVVKHHQFSARGHFVDIHAQNRTIKMCICFSWFPTL